MAIHLLGKVALLGVGQRGVDDVGPEAVGPFHGGQPGFFLGVALAVQLLGAGQQVLGGRGQAQRGTQATAQRGRQPAGQTAHYLRAVAAAVKHVVAVTQEIVGGNDALIGHQLPKGHVLRQAGKPHIEHGNAHATTFQTGRAQSRTVEVGSLAAGQQVVVGRNGLGRRSDSATGRTRRHRSHLNLPLWPNAHIKYPRQVA